MQVLIANGALTTDHASASFKHPVFILNGAVYQPDDVLDTADSNRCMTAEDLLGAAYAMEIDQGRRFSTAEYNLIARFTGMPGANLCSGE